MVELARKKKTHTSTGLIFYFIKNKINNMIVCLSRFQ
jgi:hypothetical protein